MKNIQKLRKKIDELDQKLIKVLEKRFELTKEIGEIKQEEGLGIKHENRENEVLEKISTTKTLKKSFTKKLFELIFQESRNRQK
jgi:chorismate mutase